MMERLKESKWVYVLISVVLALTFWLYVRTVQDPQDSSWIYNVPVQVTGSTVLTRQGLTVAELSAETVNLRVEGPTSTLDDLLKYRKEIYVSVDVSKCAEGENQLAYVPVYPANVNKEKLITTERNPDAIAVTVEKLYTKTFEVEFQLKGKVAKGYQAGTPAVNPETVVVSGAVEQVSRVAKVAAILENENLNERFAGDLPLTLLDASGEVLEDLEVTLDTESVYVVLPVVVVKEIPLTVNFLAGGGATEDDIRYKIEPKTITVSGAEEDLRDLTELSLGSVDLAQVRRWQDEGSIEYLGETRDVRPYVEACHALVLPSWREGTPTSIMEGMSMGRAAVVTDVPGCREVVEDGVNGCICAAHDPRALAAAMRRLLDEPGLLVRMGAAGRDLACREFDAEVVAEKILVDMRVPRAAG